MFTLTIKGLWAHKVRYALTSLAIVLGVAFMAGTMVLTDSMQKTFDGVFQSANHGTDVIVRHTEAIHGEFSSDSRGRVDAALVDRVAAVSGVGRARGSIEGRAELVMTDGSTSKTDGLGTTVGANWIDDAQLNPFTLASGHAPAAPDEVVLDKRTADKEHWSLGDAIGVLGKGGPATLKLVGTATYGELEGVPGSSLVATDDTTAQRLFAEPGRYDRVVVAAAPGEAASDLVGRIEASVMAPGSNLEVLTGDQDTADKQSTFKDDVSFINSFLMAFAFVALFVGTFIIYNTFSIVVAQRTREMALLRAIGASRAQVMRQVLGESVLVGLIASIAGIVAGVLLAVGLKAAMSLLGFDLPGSSVVLRPNAVVVGLIVGLVITVLSAIVPAWQASRVSPVAAMRDVQIERATRRGIRLGIGVTLLVAGIALLFVGVSGSVDNGIAYVGIGALMVFVAAFVLGPLFARITSLAVGAPIARARGITGTLARENAARNPKRTATTATALIIGIALVGFITIFAASAKASVSHAVDEQFKTDYIIRAGSGFGAGGLSPALATRIGELPDIQAVTGLRGANAAIDSNRTFLTAVEPNAASQLFDFTDVAGTWKSLGDDGLAVSKKKADDHHWKLGDPAMVTFVKTGNIPMKIEYIYKENTFGDYYISQGAFEKNVEQQLDFFVFAKLKPGVSAADGRAAIKPLLAAYPTAKLQDNAQFKADQQAQVNKFVALVYLLLFFALVIALIGIANTLALSIYERTREIGLLRAVGMSRRQVRSAIRWESVIIALLGAVNGLAIGLFFGWSVVRALHDQGITQFAIAPAQLIIVVVIITGLSVVAAWLPARRAAKLDVLRAISTE